MEDFIKSIPPITRTWLLTTVGIAIAAKLNLIDPYIIFFDPTMIRKSFQVWRLVTPFFSFGKVDFPWVFQMVML